MENIPRDPFMLLSFLKMKLRDEYDSLDSLCDDMGIDKDAIVEKLRDAGFEYSVEQNKFW